jgi:hypothetical protein
MSMTLERWSLELRRLQGALLGVGILLSQFGVQAAAGRQWVAFEKSYTELSSVEGQAVLRLKRFVSAEVEQQALTAPLKVRSPGGEWGVLNAYFPAGSNSGVCAVSVPEARGADLVVCLEIICGTEIQSFARSGHVVRKKSQSSVPSGAVIHAVVFSGADTPENAVETGGNRTLVEGGIVALGGQQMPPVLFPARLLPKAEYASGVWTPPLSPQVLVFQFNAWKSNKAP